MAKVLIGGGHPFQGEASQPRRKAPKMRVTSRAHLISMRSIQTLQKIPQPKKDGKTGQLMIMMMIKKTQELIKKKEEREAWRRRPATTSSRKRKD